jgi:hypothetical protein
MAMTLGNVRVDAERGSHYLTNEDGDLEVHVEIQGHEAGLWCLWSPLVAGAGWGVWFIPNEGTEVIVGFPDGDFSGDPVLLGCMPTGGIPGDLAEGRLLVTGPEVLVKGDAVTVQGGSVSVEAAGNPQTEPAYKAETHDALMQAFFSGNATLSAGVGGGVTAGLNALTQAYNAGLLAAKTGTKIS